MVISKATNVTSSSLRRIKSFVLFVFLYLLLYELNKNVQR